MRLRRYLVCFCIMMCTGIFAAASEPDAPVSSLLLRVQQNPQDAEAYYKLAIFFMSQKAYREVFAMIAEAEEKGVRNASLYQIQAEAAFLLGSVDEAMLALAKIEKLGQ